jgi:hypothetical protein
MESEFAPAIAALERRLNEVERKAEELRAAINMLCVEAGMPPRYQETTRSTNGGSPPVQINHDTFFGKKQQTAIREYLSMRKAQGLGPAKPKEIYDALAAGGYEYEAKDMNIALVGLRALLRKRYTIFQKLPNGTYGLTAWYPDAKRPKDNGAQKDDESENEDEVVEKAIPTVKRRGRPPKVVSSD